MRVLQYGVTRERLREALKEAEGWDIVHISGHGRPGELLLETAEGRQDRVTSAELAVLLDLARNASSWSAFGVLVGSGDRRGATTPARSSVLMPRDT